MTDLLLAMEKKHDFLVCVDSDGCVFDNMELKHKECFCPATVNVWDMQSVSRFTREAAEYVNLYSGTRGINRFPGLILTLEMTAARPEVRERGYKLPELAPLKSWVNSTPRFSCQELIDYVAREHKTDEVLQTAIRWSNEVDENVRRIARHLSPFPCAREALTKLSEFADIVVVSAASHEALQREWEACGLDKVVSVLAGQEMGTKAECIEKAMKGRYEPDHVLKIGDAPGDYDAARSNGVLFRPIIPGRETESWRETLEQSALRFREGTYRGAYMDGLIKAFYATLLDAPPWANVS